MKNSYRPEIDGLRAIAVSAVILYHAQIIIQGYQPFKGGFIGVDIFFVISGYLITSIILKELLKTGTFSFKYFYERRTRRILPALLFVMLVSLPFAWIYKLPSNLIDFSKSILYSLGFSSNFYFHFSGQEYGTEIGLTKPFLHTWSLSVEEQFYIIFPIILFITFKYLKKYLINILFLGFIISLLLADWGSVYNPSLNFYYLPSRGWEVLAGSMLAYYEIKFDFRNKNKILNKIAPSIGLILIIYSFFYFNDQMRHPSFFTLTPIIGVCLIIWFSNKKEIITKILSSKLFVGVGLISYSLYLWHYPVFAFVKYTNLLDHNDIFLRIIIGILIFLISIISYFFIEKPSRNKNFKFKNLLTLIIITISIISMLNLLIIKNDGFKNRFSNIYSINNFFNAELSRESLKYVEYFKNKNFIENEKTNVLIVGDSHSIDLFNIFIQNKALFNQYQFLRYNLSFGKALKNSDLDKFTASNVFKQADVLLISDYFSDSESLIKLEKFIKLFKQEKKLILTSNSNIYPDKLIYKKYSNLTLFDYFLFKDKNIIYDLDKNLSDQYIFSINRYFFENRKIDKLSKINSKLKIISSKYNIKLLFKDDYQCNIKKRICYGSTNEGFKIYYDYGHHTLEGAKFFGKIIYDLNWLKIN